MKLYQINLDYIKYLHLNFDKRVQFNVNETDEYNQNRPYLGMVLKVNDINYFAPLEHPRPEHQKFKSNTHIIKIKEGRYGLIALNNMIPVKSSQLINFDINSSKNKDILLTQFRFCKKHYDTIQDKANKVYSKRTENPNPFEEKIYCDFKTLEDGMQSFESMIIQSI